MASHPHQSLLFLSLLVYTLALVFCLVPPTCEANGDGERIDVTLYYETLCPYCSYFIAHHLIRLFTDQLLPVVNLKLVPWGNAALDPTGNFQCQHGQGECLLNTVEACAINVFPDVYKHFPFIQCIESLAYKREEGDWRTCFARASVDPNPIFDCYNKGNGRQLELQYAYETAGLNPPHTFVPWLLVNNQPLKEDYQNFVSYVCRAYQGAAPPKVCSNSRLETDLSQEKANAAKKVCYAKEPRNLTSLNQH